MSTKRTAAELDTALRVGRLARPLAEKLAMAVRATTITKLVGSAAIVLTAGTMATAGAYGAFTASSTVTQTAPGTQTGTVSMALGSSTLDVGATGLAPGDTMQRVVTLTNNGSIDYASVKLTTTAPTSSLLDTNTTDGLQVTIDKCSQAWTVAGAEYTCGGSTSAVLASQPVIGANVDLSNVALTAAAVNYLRVTLSLPTSGGNALQNLTSVIAFRFDATQRAGTAK